MNVWESFDYGYGFVKSKEDLELKEFMMKATRAEMVAAGLMELEDYKDFNPGDDCYPED